MDHHYPNSAWLPLTRETFDRLYAFRREAGLSTWEQVIERLLPEPVTACPSESQP